MSTALHIDSHGDYRINPEAVGGNIQKTIVDNEGDYDLMTGVISNFEWKTREDGGFVGGCLVERRNRAFCRYSRESTGGHHARQRNRARDKLTANEMAYGAC